MVMMMVMPPLDHDHMVMMVMVVADDHAVVVMMMVMMELRQLHAAGLLGAGLVIRLQELGRVRHRAEQLRIGAGLRNGRSRLGRRHRGLRRPDSRNARNGTEKPG